MADSQAVTLPPDAVSVSGLPADASPVNPTAYKSWSDKMGLQNPILRGITDFGEGAVSGAASTVFHGGDLLRRAMGAPRIINTPDVQNSMTAPDSFAGKAGKFVEQGAEFAVPGGIVSDAAKGASLIPRMLAQAGTAAAVSGVQTGGDVKSMGEAAALGAGGEALAAAAGSSKAAQHARPLPAG